jgi:TetR/AcrR family transcriptional regulator, ethionamide resistance regulator
VSQGARPARARHRRRRTPEVAEEEIVVAAETLLRERPFRELTVDEVMRRTELSRPSFYVYFRDRHHLVLRVVEHLGSELFAISETWLEGSAGKADARVALEGIVALYERHGPVLRALADAAADDRDVEAAYEELVTRFVTATARHVSGERAGAADPREVAAALVWMMERYLTQSLGREPRTPAAVVFEALATIWSRVLYDPVEA